MEHVQAACIQIHPATRSQDQVKTMLLGKPGVDESFRASLDFFKDLVYVDLPPAEIAKQPSIRIPTISGDAQQCKV